MASGCSGQMSTSHGIHHEMVVNGIARYADVTVSVYLLLQGFDEVVQEGEVPVGARFCVGEVVEARELEPQGVAPLATVHVVPERQHDLQELLESLAALYFLGCFQDSNNLWLAVCNSFLKLLFVV